MTDRGARRVSRAVALVLTALVPAICSAPLRAGGFNPNAPAFADLYGAFNESYKQALYATERGDAKRSRSELMGTRVAWEMLLRQYSTRPPEAYRGDAQWQRDLAAITRYIEMADSQLKLGKLPDAHEALEPIRWTWLAIRERSGVRWFGDELARFDGVMAPVVRLAASGVTASGLAGFQAKFGRMSASWKKVEEFGYRPRSVERRKALAEMMATERQAIENLRRATEAQDYASLGPLAEAVKKAFAAVYLAFG